MLAAVALGQQPAARPAAARPPAALFDRVADVLRERFYDRAFRTGTLPALIEEYRPAAAAAADRDEQRGVVHAFLGRFPASHLALYSRHTHARLEAELTGKALPTLGCELLALDGRFYVDAVYDGGPAERQGLQRGDEVLAIDGVATGSSPRLDWRSDDAALDDPPLHDLVVGAGDVVTLTVGGKGGGRDVAVPAERYSGLLASRHGIKVLEAGGHRALYVHLWFVYHLQAARLLRDALEEHDDCTALLLDLRGRGGSALECPGVVQQVRSVRARGLPVVALIDARTRSAKEVIAWELQQRELATLVGERTAGAVLPATFEPVGDDSVLMFPASRLGSYTQAIEGIGVAPDREVRDPLPCAPGADPILAAGVAALVEQFAPR